MKNPKLNLIALFLGVLFMAGCEYAFIERTEITPPDPDPDNPISFETQIVPIFTSRCLDCHDTGGTSPDLSAENAYNSITNNNLVDTDNPSESVIFDYVQPSTSPHAWRKYTTAQATLVLQWIQEGALNN